mgnify:CR=1 FL=1
MKHIKVGLVAFKPVINVMFTSFNDILDTNIPFAISSCQVDWDAKPLTIFVPLDNCFVPVYMFTGSPKIDLS